MQNLVSIIMPSYNASKFIGVAIESVINQTYTSWELLITDDCSIDNTVEIIKSYAALDDRIRIFPQNINNGAALARNISLSHALGRFIAFLDSDDLWAEDKLEKQLIFMKKNQCAFSFSAYNVINESGDKAGKNILVPPKINYNQYLKNTIIGCLTVIIDRKQTGDFYMPNIKSSHDMALWLLIMKRGFEAYGLNEVLASYRLVSNSNTAVKWKAAKDVWRVYREIEGLSLFYASICFCFYSFNAVLKRL